jgi:electron transfer flavoprotein alpha subunit
MTTLLIAEHDNGILSGETDKALTAALALGEPVDVLVAGQGVAEAGKQAATLSGAAKVLVADDATLANGLAEPLAELIISLADNYAAIVAPATANGKNVMPRVAAKLDVMQLSDIIAVESPTVFRRPVYAGSAIETVETNDAKRVLTVRTSAFAAAARDGSAPVETVSAPQVTARAKFVSENKTQSERPDLNQARVVVSGGRAFGSKEKFDALLNPLAEKLGAAIGASRAAVDSGYASNDLQVGQTGKVVAPELYIACGISGAVQHLAGMKDAKVIVAINKDGEAPIFKIADYGLVGDVFTLLPELTGKL